MAHRRRRAGFTLIELLVVVVVVGVLAAVALPAFTAQLYRSRMEEGFEGLAEIRRAQNAYYALYTQYANLPWNPVTVPPGDAPVVLPSEPSWDLVGVELDGPTRFRYRVIAGPPAAPPPVPMPNDDHWYVAQAEADLDGDGVTVALEAYSVASTVYVSRGVAGPYLPQGYE